MSYWLRLSLWIALWATALFGVISLTRLTDDPLDWNQSFTKYSDMPYGCELFHAGLEALHGQSVQTLEQPAFLSFDTANRWRRTPEGATAIYIGNYSMLDEHDVNQLYEYARRGGRVLLALSWIDEDLQELLNLKTSSTYESGDSIEITSTLSQRSWNFQSDSRYSIHEYVNAEVLARDELGNSAAIKIRVGKGAFVITTYPQIFTNLYCRNESRGMALDLLAAAHVPGQPILWDEYHKPDRVHVRSELKYILSQPPLRHAYYVILALLLILVFVSLKRRQKAIPIVKPPANSTLDYVHTVGMLHHNRGEHISLANKMQKQFYNYCRNTLLVRESPNSPDFLQILALRTRIEHRVLQTLIHRIDRTVEREYIAEAELVELNTRLENFYSATK